jgi:hypothetical protein
LSHEITIQWNPSPGTISGYNVYRGTVSGNEAKLPLNGTTLIPPSATPTYVDTTVAAGVVYYYEITAVLNGIESLDSVQVKSAPVPFAPSPSGIQLGNASSFGVLAGSTVTNTGPTAVIGDVGVSPGTAITGFGAPASITGVFHAGDFVAAAAQQDLTTAYNAAAAATNPAGLFPPTVVSYGVTSVATSSAGGTALYTGTFPATSLAGQSVTLSGFTNAGNNGTFNISASTITSIMVNNANAIAETATASATVTTGSGTAAIVLSGDIGGQTLTPGVYASASSLAITGTLTLNAQGNQDAVFIFQVGSTLTTAASNSSIALVGGASASNIYWQVGSSATLGIGTSFSGILMAQASITANTGASINGQLLARTGAVTMDSNNVSLFIPGVLVLYTSNTPYNLGDIIFDCATHTFQEVIVAGTTCAAAPSFNPAIGGTTADCGVTWLTLNPPVGTLLPLPPSPPNVPPTPPAAPLNPRITSEA